MSHLLFRPEVFRDRIENFGFEYLSFETRKLAPGQKYESKTGAPELGIVLLGGTCSVTSSRGEWQRIGKRKTVFDGYPFTVYLPINTSFTVTTDEGCDLASVTARRKSNFPPASSRPTTSASRFAAVPTPRARFTA